MKSRIIFDVFRAEAALFQGKNAPFLDKIKRAAKGKCKIYMAEMPSSSPWSINYFGVGSTGMGAQFPKGPP